MFVIGILGEGILLTLHPPFVAAARDHDRIYEDPVPCFRTIAEGIYPEGIVIDSLPSYQQKSIAVLVRMLADIALTTLSSEDRELLAISRAPTLRLCTAIRASHRLLSRYLGSPRGREVFAAFLKPDIGGVVRHAWTGEAAAGGHTAAVLTFVVPDPAQSVAWLDDRVENMPGTNLRAEHGFDGPRHRDRRGETARRSETAA